MNLIKLEKAFKKSSILGKYLASEDFELSDQEIVETCAVLFDAGNLKLIENPSKIVQCVAVHSNPSVIGAIREPCEEVCNLFLDAKFKDHYSAYRDKIIRKHGSTFLDRFPEKCLVRLAGMKSDFIRYIQNPTDDMKMSAIERAGMSIRWIENPTEEMQMLAVLKNPSIIHHIDPMVLCDAARDAATFRRKL